ncbi:MAG: hypothetical protein ACXW0H_04435 [Methylobacter sp.]
MPSPNLDSLCLRVPKPQKAVKFQGKSGIYIRPARPLCPSYHPTLEKDMLVKADHRAVTTN